MKNPDFIHPSEELSGARQEIARYLSKLRFKRSFLGVSEADVWKKLQELDGLYDQAIKAERARYDALLEDHQRACVEAIKRAKAAASPEEE